MTPTPSHLSPEDAVRLYATSELYHAPGHLIAKSTLHEHYVAWTLEAPGRPSLSSNLLSRLLRKVRPEAGTVLSPRFVTLHNRVERPSCWQGIRFAFPPDDDPYEEELRLAEVLAEPDTSPAIIEGLDD